MRRDDWLATRSFGSGAFSRSILAGRDQAVSVAVPTLDEATSIARTLEPLQGLLERGLIDQLAVIDSGSRDGTPEIVSAMGVEVFDARALLPDVGPLLGKGDAMWRAVTVLHGDVICYVDADSEDFGEHFIVRLAGPLLRQRNVAFVKGRYLRPLKLGDRRLSQGGGRVTELTARPLLNAFYPELGVFDQPLSGEIAASRELLRSVPFDTGYAVEIGMLIDVYTFAGLGAMAQVDLGTRQNRHRPLGDLVPMAGTVVQAVVRRLERENRLSGGVSTTLSLSSGRKAEVDLSIVQRPPLVTREPGLHARAAGF